MGNCRRNNGKEGLTLVEVVVAVSILGFIFSAFLLAMIAAARMQYIAGENYSAMVVARNRIEDAKVRPYGSLGFMEETLTQVDHLGEACSTGRFWRATTVTPSAVDTNCVEVLVEVTYEVRPGVTSVAPVRIRTVLGNF